MISFIFIILIILIIIITTTITMGASLLPGASVGRSGFCGDPGVSCGVLVRCMWNPRGPAALVLTLALTVDSISGPCPWRP